MPTDECRRLLKTFGFAMTEFEDAVHRNDPAEQVAKADGNLRERLDEVIALIERLRRRATSK